MKDEDRCEASGVMVVPNMDGRATCPLCGDAWHCITSEGRLRTHKRNRYLTPAQVLALLEAAKDHH